MTQPTNAVPIAPLPLVLDASVLAEYLLDTHLGIRAAELMLPFAGNFHIPEFAVAETLSVIRKLALNGFISADRAQEAIDDLLTFPARRWQTDLFVRRAWELHSNLTAYDAIYVALAESLGASFLTGDIRAAHGAEAAKATCPIIVLSDTP